MLCIVSHYPTLGWQLLPTGAARDASLTTPQPQLILIVQTLLAAIPALLGEVTDSSLQRLGAKQAILKSHSVPPSQMLT